MRFEITAQSANSRARTGELHLAHGTVVTPAFMPCASRAAVRACGAEDVAEAGVQILVSNAYHLYLQPGMEAIEACGGLHRFMDWNGPILTDSGGFQVFSLAAPKDIAEEGVIFRSPVDGQQILFTPELCMEIQNRLGSDIAMPLDECCPHPAERDYVRASLERTLRWAERCKAAHERDDRALFGIVQGGVYADLRELSATETARLGFPGYAIGGLSVGESREQMLGALRAAMSALPLEAPVHLMGVGTPLDIVDCAAEGVDLFDCVLPTRNARHGSVMTWAGPLRILNATYATDPRPLEEGCECPCCRSLSRAYLRHLFKAKESLAWRLLSLHNLRFYTDLMRRLREAIATDRLADLRSRLSAWTQRDRS